MNWFTAALDTETWFGEVIHIGIQIIIWQRMKPVINKYFANTKWHKKAVATTNDTNGGVLGMLWMFVQHSVTLFIGFIGYYSGYPALFRIGVTAEIAFALVGSHSMMVNRKVLMAKDKLQFNAILVHHAADILSLVPVNIYMGDNIRLQRFIISMMALVPFYFILWIVNVTRNKNDLNERAQFAVLSFIHILNFIYWRFYDSPYCFAEWLEADFMDSREIIKFVTIVGYILNNIFNVLWLYIDCKKLYVILFGRQS